MIKEEKRKIVKKLIEGDVDDDDENDDDPDKPKKPKLRLVETSLE